MKKCVSIILIVVLLCLIGCSNTSKSIEKPAGFYYCTSPDSYKTLRKAITSEVRDAAVYGDDLQNLLNEYLKGPESDSLVNPFPDNCTVESFQQNDANARIVLSSSFSSLTGLELTLACACLSMTVFELSDYQSITFSVQNALLDGSKEITLYRQDILLEYIDG